MDIPPHIKPKTLADPWFQLTIS